MAEPPAMPMLTRLAVLAAAAALTACGPTRPRSHAAPASAADAVLTDRDIEQTSARTAWDAVQWLCPPRVRGTVEQRSIFLDGIRVHGATVLREVPSGAVREIRWLDARDAVIRYGSAHADGVILVVTKPGG